MDGVLAVLSDGRERSSNEIREKVADRLGLTSRDLSKPRGGNPSGFWKNEHAFALKDLSEERRAIVKVAVRSGRRIYKITPNGRALLKSGELLRKNVGRGASRSDQAARPEQPRRRATRPRMQIGSPRSPLTGVYRPVDERRAGPRRDPFPFDPEDLDRKTLEHRKLQNELAVLAKRAGFVVHSPNEGDPVDFDLAWTSGDGHTLIEVKTLSNTVGDAKQIRLGIGQVLDYQHRLRAAGVMTRAVLVVDRQPTDMHWVELCTGHGILIAWPETFLELFATS
jgi:Mrr N-terminal domain